MSSPAGSLYDQVTFSERNVVSDNYGGTQASTWADRFTVRARIWPRLGGEQVIAARLQGTQPVTIRVRKSSDTRLVDPTWKAKNARSGTEYNIRSCVDPYEHTHERNRWIDCECVAGVQI